MADDFMARHARVNGVVPVVVHLMGVRVADAAIGDIDGDIIGAQGSALETDRGQGSVGLVGGKS
jgi:hypothetical protein